MTDKDNITLHHLAAPRLEVTVDPRLTAEEAAAISAALAAEQPKHPGYIIGSHWLETAYSRVCAGEAEADVLRDCGWERVDDIEALRRDAESWRLLRKCFDAAEFEGWETAIQSGDINRIRDLWQRRISHGLAAIDAAMEGKR